MTHVDTYPTFSRGERIADALMHIAGLSFALIGSVLLIVWAAGALSGGAIAGLSIYGAALIASFAASACYHFTPWEGPRPVLRRIDHAAIYLKIAGTYTPLVVLVGSAFAYTVLALVWGLAALGAMAKLFFWGRPGHGGTLLYLGLGWISIALFTSLVPLLTPAAIGLLIAGGLVYSVGAAVFSLRALAYQTAIWHGFVLVASVCFFTAITLAVTQTA